LKQHKKLYHHLYNNPWRYSSDEPWPAEQPPLAVFPDCTRRCILIISILSAELKIGDGANKKIDIEDSLLDKMWKVLVESFEGICSANLHFP
jgi:hypothetical protein